MERTVVPFWPRDVTPLGLVDNIGKVKLHPFIVQVTILLGNRESMPNNLGRWLFIMFRINPNDLFIGKVVQ
jgi:hypothetical protein